MVKQYKHKGKKKSIVLEEAKKIAQHYIDEFKPFSYNDVGLKYNRWYRKAFTEWAKQNKVEFVHTHTSGKRGFQDGMFYPYRYDENGKQIFATLSAKEESSVN